MRKIIFIIVLLSFSKGSFGENAHSFYKTIEFVDAEIRRMTESKIFPDENTLSFAIEELAIEAEKVSENSKVCFREVRDNPKSWILLKECTDHFIVFGLTEETSQKNLLSVRTIIKLCQTIIGNNYSGTREQVKFKDNCAKVSQAMIDYGNLFHYRLDK